MHILRFFIFYNNKFYCNEERLQKRNPSREPQQPESIKQHNENDCNQKKIITEVRYENDCNQKKISTEIISDSSKTSSPRDG